MHKHVADFLTELRGKRRCMVSMIDRIDGRVSEKKQRHEHHTDCVLFEIELNLAKAVPATQMYLIFCEKLK